MGFLKHKKQNTEQSTEVAAAAESSAPPRVVQTQSLTSGRMATFFQSLYQWIFSVSIPKNVYQIESGSDSFSELPLPIRGYYSDLLSRFSTEMVAEQREKFLQLFSAENVKQLVKGGYSNLKEEFCAQELGREGEAADSEKTFWYEFRLEWPGNADLKNFICVFTVRRINSDLDTGKTYRKKTPSIQPGERSHDWDSLRARSLQDKTGVMTFEYNIATDCLTLHRQQGDSSGDRVTENYMASLDDRSNHFLALESIDTMKKLLRADRGRGTDSGDVLYRRHSTPGAPYEHHRVLTAPVMEGESIIWIIGQLTNTEEQALAQEISADLAGEISNMFEAMRMHLYQINLSQNLIYHISQDTNGFRREAKPMSLTEYIKRQVTLGIIAPEDKEKYMRWTENGYLQRITASGSYEFEARLKLRGHADYSWYLETITAVPGKTSRFIRCCRENNEGHKSRESEFMTKEQSRIAEYNFQMLDTLASLVEFRNVESNDHIKHVSRITRILLQDLKLRSPNYNITNADIDQYVRASVMHDIGKITVPDYILNKKGLFTPEEFEIMKKHTTDGALIVERLNIPGQEQLKSIIYDVVLHHHERYDGNGYPDKLKGDAINIGVQVVSLADVYDALVSERCYKKSYGFDEAMRMIQAEECGVFNPRVVESLKAMEEIIRQLYTGEGQ